MADLATRAPVAAPALRLAPEPTEGTVPRVDRRRHAARAEALRCVAALLVGPPSIVRLDAAITAVTHAPADPDDAPGTAHARRVLLAELRTARAKLVARAAPGSRHCPHCLGELRDHDHRHATRCTTCRLLVGAGRSLNEHDLAAVTRSTQTGTGALAARVRREAQAREQRSDPAMATRDIRRVAAGLGIPAERLRMFDYEAARNVDDSLMALSEIVATLGSWKRARSVAHEEVRRP